MQYFDVSIPHSIKGCTVQRAVGVAVREQVLEFSNALGMLIEGFVHFEGTRDQPITLRLRNESTWINNTRVRLVDGPSLLEGRLEVRPTEDDEWGTVCRDVSVVILLSWSGIHFLGNTCPSVMTHTSVSGAGLMDPAITHCL